MDVVVVGIVVVVGGELVGVESHLPHVLFGNLTPLVIIQEIALRC